MFGEGLSHGGVPGVPVLHRGESLARELADELQLDVVPGLGQPASNLSLKLVYVGGGSDPATSRQYHVGLLRLLMGNYFTIQY